MFNLNQGESGIKLQPSNYLTHMATLIKQNPSITVRELATELRFADSKSVYYWLEKGKYSGINDFKRQVLSESVPHPSSYQLEIEGVTHYLVILPLFEWNPKEKRPRGEWFYFHRKPLPQGLYALQIDTDQYYPWIKKNDILIISEETDISPKSWVLLKSAQAFHVGKSIGDQIIDPKTYQAYPNSFKQEGIILNVTTQLLP